MLMLTGTVKSRVVTYDRRGQKLDQAQMPTDRTRRKLADIRIACHIENGPGPRRWDGIHKHLFLDLAARSSSPRPPRPQQAKIENSTPGRGGRPTSLG